MDYKDPHERNSLCTPPPHPPSLSCSILILVPVFPGMEPCPGRQQVSLMSLPGLPCYSPFRFRPLHPPTVAGDRTSPASVGVFKLAAQLFSDHYFGFFSQVHYLLSLFLPSFFPFLLTEMLFLWKRLVCPICFILGFIGLPYHLLLSVLSGLFWFCCLVGLGGDSEIEKLCCYHQQPATFVLNFVA